MRHSRVLLAALTAALAAGAPGPAALAQERREARPFIHVLDPRDRAPRIREDVVDLRVPVAVRRGVPVRKVVLALVDVRPQSALAEPEAGTFRLLPRGQNVKHLLAGRGRAPAIGVRVDASRLPAGRYRVIVQARRQRSRRVVRMRFPVVISAPALAAGTVRARRTTWQPGGGVKVEPLTLRETSGRSQITDLRVTQVAQLGGGGVVPGEVQLEGLPARIGPGRAVQITPRLSGDFPLGTSTGTLQIDARELPQPVQLPFQVEARRTPLLLLALLIAGVVLGWLTRVGLQRKLERTEGLLRLSDLHLRVRRERDRQPDGKLRRRLADLERGIRDDLSTLRDAAAMATALANHERELSNALKQLETDLTAQTARLEQLAPFLAGGGALPGGADAALIQLRTQLAMADDKLSRQDAEGAEEALDEAERIWRDEALPAVRAWRDAALDLVDAAQSAKVARGAANEALAARAALDALDPDTATAAAALAPARAARSAMDALRRRLQGTLAETANEVVDTLAPLDGANGAGDPLARAGVDAAFKRVSQSLATATGASPDAYHEAATALNELDQQLVTLIRSCAKADSQAMDAALESDDLVAAARAAAATMAEEEYELHLEELDEEIEGEEDVGARAMMRAVARRFIAAPARGGARFAPGPTVPDAPAGAGAAVLLGRRPARVPEVSTPAWRAALMRERDSVDKWRTFLIAVAVVAVGYLLLVDDFVGTTRDLLAAFAFGYTANLSVDWLREHLPQAPAPGTPTGTART